MERFDQWIELRRELKTHRIRIRREKGRPIEKKCDYVKVWVTRVRVHCSLSLSLIVEDVPTGAQLTKIFVSANDYVDVGVFGPELCSGKDYGGVRPDLTDFSSLAEHFITSARAPLERKLFGWTEQKEVLVAKPDELKPGNAFARAKLWKEALNTWQSAPLKESKTEAYPPIQSGRGL